MSQAQPDGGQTSNNEHGHPAVVIHIDKHEYHVHESELTGEQLRAVPDPDIAADRDLWREVPGGTDVKVEKTDVVVLHNGLHLFTAPREITPGHDASHRR
ncbi:MAG: hypothetical protein QOE09_1359 [Ilumatobacteraceae bacterium]|jgi:hypothetical protein